MTRALRLVITPGDPGGIGPEVMLAALAARGLADDEAALIVLPAGAETALDLAAVEAVLPVPRTAVASFTAGALTLALEPADWAGSVPVGAPSAAGSRAAWHALVRAVDLCLKGEAGGLATGPLSKRGLAAIGVTARGHTEYLAQRAGVPVRMAFRGVALRVVLQTVHCPLAAVAGRLSADEIMTTLRLTVEYLRRDEGLKAPRLAVLGLNPHAGEDGLLGTEERDVIAPALAQPPAGAGAIEGPFAADGFFARRRDREFDAVVAMYHDQGLIPAKLLEPDAVNVTLGLPFVRCSVGHGTAFDRAGRGTADCAGARAALDAAFAFLRRRGAAIGPP